MTIISRQIHKWHLMHDKFCLILPGRWIRKHIVRYSAVSLQSASAWLMMVTAAGRGTAGAAASPDNEAHNTNLPDKVRDGEHSELWWVMLSLWWAMLSRVTREILLISRASATMRGTQQSQQSCKPSVKWCFVCNDWFAFLYWNYKYHHFKIK